MDKAIKAINTIKVVDLVIIAALFGLIGTLTALTLQSGPILVISFTVFCLSIMTISLGDI